MSDDRQPSIAVWGNPLVNGLYVVSAQEDYVAISKRFGADEVYLAISKEDVPGLIQVLQAMTDTE